MRVMTDAKGDWIEEGRDRWVLYTHAPRMEMVPMGLVRPVHVGLLRRQRYQAWVSVGDRSDGTLALLTTEDTLEDARAVVQGDVPVPRHQTRYGKR